MRNIYILLFMFFPLYGISQVCNPLANAVITVSGTYGASNKINTTNCNACDTWNAGNYSGWIAYDMINPVTINSFFIIRSMFPAGNMTQFIDTSSDGVTWVPVLNISGSYANGSKQFIDLPAPWQNVRYFRIRGTGGVSWMSLYQVMINYDLINNEVTGMSPVVLNEQGKLLSGTDFALPMTIYASKADTYQWKLNGGNIPGANSQSYQVTQNGNYSVEVSYTASPCNPVATSPAQGIVGPVLWLRADGTIAYNGSNQVSQWNDMSGVNNHVTQPNAVNRPLYQAQGFGNKPSVYFDGGNGKSFLHNTALNLVGAGGARTVFVVGRRDCNTHPNGVVGGTLFTFCTSAPVNSLSYAANSYGTPVYIYSDGVAPGNNNASITPSAIDTALNPFVITYKVPAAGSQIACQINSLPQLVSQPGVVANETGAAGFTVGDREDQPDLDWSGWISEVIVYNRTLSPAEVTAVEEYLKNKYFSNTAFTSLPASGATASDSYFNEGWQHSFNATTPTEVIASVNSYCLDMGSRTDTVYVEPTAINYNGSYAMRRHYTINTTLNPAGTKRVRLYYTQSDFNDLQTMVPGLTSHSQLVVTKYDGPNEDGIFDPMGGTLTFIPSALITTGTAFGQYYLEFDVTGFSEFWIHAFDVPLPVQFTSFDVHVCMQNKACIQWNTAREENILSYAVERSTDGQQFSQLSVVAGAGDSETGHEYRYTDLDPVNGLNYYRIKSIDVDGHYTYTPVQSIMIRDGSFDVSLWPVSSADGLFQINTTRSLSAVRVYNTGGQLLMSTQLTGGVLDLSHLAAGMYLLELQSEGEKVVKKIVRE